MILAIDPGGTTGLAYLTRDGAFGTGQREGGAEGMWPLLDGWAHLEELSHEPVDAIVIENFVPRPGAKSMQLDALHIIGAVKYLCAVNDIPLIVQTPAQAKAFATNDKLKAVGWYSVGEDHGRDAARHLLVFVASSPAVIGGGPYAPERARIFTALAAL